MEKPIYLNYLETLEARINLPDDAKNRLWRQHKGFEGHQAFDDILRAFVPQDFEILHNLNFNLEVGKCQIDSLLIRSAAIYHFEVKNLVGEAGV